jgi:hypothetical protein
MMMFDYRRAQPFLLALAVAALSSSPVAADPKPPTVTEWMFMEMTGTNDTCVDWEAEGSIQITTDKKIRETIEFGIPAAEYGPEYFTISDESGNEFYIGGTSWLRVPVVHLTSSGQQVVGHVYWLLQDVDGDGKLDEPKKGLTASAGPEGDVAHYATALATKFSGNDFYNPNKAYIVPSSGAFRLCFAVGEFSK